MIDFPPRTTRCTFSCCHIQTSCQSPPGMERILGPIHFCSKNVRAKRVWKGRILLLIFVELLNIVYHCRKVEGKVTGLISQTVAQQHGPDHLPTKRQPARFPSTGREILRRVDSAFGEPSIRARRQLSILKTLSSNAEAYSDLCSTLCSPLTSTPSREGKQRRRPSEASLVELPITWKHAVQRMLSQASRYCDDCDL